MPLALMVGAGALYGLAVARRPEWPRRRAAYFAACLAVTVIATESLLGIYPR